MQVHRFFLRLNFSSWPLWFGGGLFVAYLGAVVLIFQEGHESARRGEVPLFTDYTSLYAASLLVRQEDASHLYLGQKMHAATLQAAQVAYDGTLTNAQMRQVGFHPWMYPPHFIFFAVPLAYLGYLLSCGAWLLATAVPYIFALRGILRDHGFWLVALASPPVFFNLMYGQTGFLTAGLIGLGLAWLTPRPLWAGIFLGLASVKPHFGVLIPFALIAARQWQTFLVASVTVVGLILASILAFGIDSWYGFIGSVGNNFEGFQVGVYKWTAMSSVLGLLHSLGLRMAQAWYGQALASFSVLLLAIWAWRGATTTPAGDDLRRSILCSATLLAVPMVYLYDLMLAVPAIAWLWADMRRRGAARWEPWLLAVSSAAMLGLREIAWVSGVQPGALLVAVILWLAVRRFESAQNGPA